MTDAVASNRNRNLKAGECLVLEIVTEWIQNPPKDEEGSIDCDVEGKEWVVIPAQAVSDLLLERHNVTYSVQRTRTAINREPVISVSSSGEAPTSTGCLLPVSEKPWGDRGQCPLNPPDVWQRH